MVRIVVTILGGHGFEIRVEGHTDDVPVHNTRFKSNWELSTARATAVVSLLIEHHGFDPALVSAADYSKYRPVEGNRTAQGRAANRRLDLVVVGTCRKRTSWPAPGGSGWPGVSIAESGRSYFGVACATVLATERI